MKTDPEIIYGE